MVNPRLSLALLSITLVVLTTFLINLTRLIPNSPVVWNNSQTPIMSNQVSNSNQATWKIHSNTTYQYQLKYPPSWQTHESVEPDLVSLYAGERSGDMLTKYAEITILARPVDQEFTKMWNLTPESGKILEIDGQKALVQEPTDSRPGKTYSFLHQSVFYQIQSQIYETANLPEYLKKIAEPPEYYQKVFNQILSTFKFLEPSP